MEINRYSESEPNPELQNYGKEYSHQMDRLESIREKFLEQRSDLDIKNNSINAAIQNFESNRILRALSNINDPDITNFLENTYIDTERKTLDQTESILTETDSKRHKTSSKQYSLDSSGALQEKLIGNEEDGAIEVKPGHDNPFQLKKRYKQLDANQARSVAEKIKQIVDILEVEYNNPDWYVMPHSINTKLEGGEKYYVIERAQADED